MWIQLLTQEIPPHMQFHCCLSTVRAPATATPDSNTFATSTSIVVSYYIEGEVRMRKGRVQASPFGDNIKSASITIIKVGMKLLKIRIPKVQALIVLIAINRS